jgi:Leucine-rich repeat (LRR) protein
VRFPEAAVARIAATLVKLDLSENEISSISGGQVECMQNLRWLSLSNNRIVVISDLTFDPLRALLYLDLSGNPMGRISAR